LRKRFRLIIASSVLLLGGLALFWWFQERGEGLPSPGERVNILILGLDYVEGKSRSDTILFASLKEKDVVLISVPRDLRLKFPDGKLHKANAAYSIGGARLARKVVANFLDIRIPFYVVIDYKGFESLIEILGGVDITIEKPLKYEDKAQGLKIDLPAGPQHLSGKQALDYVRYRDEQGDYGRIRRQQNLLKALLEKGLQFESLAKLKEMIKAGARLLNTNLALVDMYTLMERLQGLQASQVVMASIPGESVIIDKVSYLEPDLVRTKALIDELILGKEVLTPDEIKVLVLNGSGASGVARQTTEFLRTEGFQMAEPGNAESFDYTKNYIVNLSGDVKKAEMLKAALAGEIELVSPEAFKEHLEKISQKHKLEGLDLLFIFGKGFQLKR